MFDYSLSNNNDRPRGALEVAMHARKHEKALAQAFAELRAEVKPSGNKKNNRGLLANLFSIFK